MKVAKEKKCCLITTLTNKVAISIGPLNISVYTLKYVQGRIEENIFSLYIGIEFSHCEYSKNFLIRIFKCNIMLIYFRPNAFVVRFSKSLGIKMYSLCTGFTKLHSLDVSNRIDKTMTTEIS